MFLSIQNRDGTAAQLTFPDPEDEVSGHWPITVFVALSAQFGAQALPCRIAHVSANPDDPPPLGFVTLTLESLDREPLPEYGVCAFGVIVYAGTSRGQAVVAAATPPGGCTGIPGGHSCLPPRCSAGRRRASEAALHLVGRPY
jgi:hypothetical protein